ncbi:putative bifunctional diguanylate cyclase/phosphodiesterase [Xylophilus sp.]|uniref:putative bifunctional diguanylate cyclase/phosphodiesterase n=1 Tax=Xylophilus sp. TaxID=2653893 RepID=UPI0013BD19ED|nr:EAL domain-containing protein [Xylophilus sp.]KAF1049408.1 MAG: Phytochrome-like protein cph2 [Xylophilus sp.]
MPSQPPHLADSDAAGTAFSFAAETDAAAPADGAPLLPAFTILTADDDPQFQAGLRLALQHYRFQSRPVELIAAGSAAAAAKVLSERDDIALIILDVVMETDDAGLRLVRSVRELLGNAEVRIVLVTGQPGMSSMKASLDLLDISDYWLKTDLTIDRLHGILTSNLRTWQQIRALGRARKGLQAIVEAGNSLNRARGLRDFSQRLMHEMARLLRLEPDGLVCVQEDPAVPPLAAHVVGAAGRFAPTISEPLAALQDTAIRDLLSRSLADRASIDADGAQVLFFAGKHDGGPHAAAYIATRRALDATERELLRVFATNINTGLINVSLASRLDRIAYEDALLRMPNGNARMRALEGAMDIAAPRRRALLLVDLDQYFQACLTLGMEQGDLMLHKLALRLRTTFPPPCLVARLQDDTFAILGDSELLRPERVNQLESADPENPTHPPFFSLGAARIDLDLFDGSAREALTIGTLLLKRARSQGLSQLAEYVPGMERENDRRFTLSRQLFNALHIGQIRIELQPQVELESGRICGAEALARWTRADGTEVSPADFIPVAEANGLIVPLGRQVIELACQALARLRDEGHPRTTIAVNVSTLQLVRQGFTRELLDAVARHGVTPQQLEIEITESVAMGDHQSDGAILRGLREAGFPIAIDDFGTGYSSLGYLRTLPITTLKIDRCFVAEIGVVPVEHEIADMVIRVAQRMGLKVLAEGVETAAQLAWLRERGCHLAQGYFLGRPASLDDFVRRLRAPGQPRP